jgi:hypothetical protein
LEEEGFRDSLRVTAESSMLLIESDMFFHMSTVEGLQWDEQLTGRRVEFETIVAPNGRPRAMRVRARKLGQRMYDSPLPSAVESERTWCPSPKQIRAGCLEIQSGWTDDERRRRSAGWTAAAAG